MVTKKGSKAYRAKMSKLQKAAWKKRRAKVITNSFTVDPVQVEKEPIEYEPFELSHTGTSHGSLKGPTANVQSIPRVEIDVIKWVNEADTPSERQLRKAAMHAALYSGPTTFGQGLRSVAEGIRDDIEKDKARKESLVKEGIQTGRWSTNAKPYNPDSLFVKPPIHDNPISPAHYQQHSSGIECIVITEHFNFNLGNVIKYIWRADEKGSPLENLRKAQWYLNREIERLEKEALGQ